MRIGIDMLGEQSPSSRHRGIGRYVLNFVSQLLRRDNRHEFVLYYYGGLERTPLPLSPRTSQVWLDGEANRGRLDRVVQEMVDRNPEELDLYLVLSPLECYRHWVLPRRGLNGLALGALCHDLIPILYADKYLPRPIDLAAFQRSLHTMEQYDLVLTNSDATKHDCESVLGMDPRRVVSINAGVDAEFWRPAEASDAAKAASVLAKLGIERPFVFNLSGIDWRKNLHGLIDAYAQLPAQLHESHQLVLTMSLSPDDARGLHEYAQDRGVGRQLIVTGFQSDETIRTLYQTCAAFVFPSHYEGFGFPIVEAMRCQAPVVAGNNSSQVQLVGDAGLLCDTWDTADIADKLAKALDDRELRDDFKRRSPEVAARFSWEATADLASAAFDEFEFGERPARPRLSDGRPRLAVFAPLASKVSATTQQAQQWIAALAEHYQLDVFHDGDQVPLPARLGGNVSFHDYRLFPRYQALLNYACLIYRLADDADHTFAYTTMLKHPGIVVLQDFSLVALQHALARRSGTEYDWFRQELALSPLGLAADVLSLHDENDLAGLRAECAQRGLWLNRRVFERARHVVLGDGWTWARAQATYPIYAEKTALIPEGTTVSPCDAARRRKLRERLGLAVDNLAVIAMGELDEPLLHDALIESFAALASSEPSAVLLLECGRKNERRLSEQIHTWELDKRVRFVPTALPAVREELALAGDLAVHLRRPPTQGEAMNTLTLLLAAGLPTIVNDVEGFGTLPDEVVEKVRWDALFTPALQSALCTLGCDPDRRAELATAARRHAQRYHSWRRIGALYKELIDNSIRSTTMRRGNRVPQLKLRAAAAV